MNTIFLFTILIL